MNLKPNTEVLKEPRGFIKVIQFFSSIVAFACVVDWRGVVEVKVACTPKDVFAKASFAYPFAMDEVSIKVPVCTNHSVKAADIDFVASEVNQSQFFVFIGVVCFLATIALTAGYVLYDDVYVRTPRVVWADVILHAAFAFFWFVASCTFASSISDIKEYTGGAFLKKALDECKNYSCEITKDPTYAGLHIAALVGFLNAFLWGSNLWFLYKETRAQQGDFVDETVGGGVDDVRGPGGGGGYDPYNPYGPGPTGSQWGSGPGGPAVQSGVNDFK